MARPLKNGLDYFPLDVNMDGKTEILESQFGLEGFAIYIKLLQECYKYEAGKIPLTVSDIPTTKILSRKFCISEDKLTEIISFCCDINLFDKRQQKMGYLTSNGIIKRIEIISKKRIRDRKNKQLHTGIFGSENETKTERKLSENEAKTPERKEKKSKGKESKENKYILIQEKWNNFAKESNLPQVLNLSKQRESHIQARLKEKLFDFDKILAEIKISDFLLGIKNDWKVDFDFIFSSANNYLKILEGKYRNKGMFMQSPQKPLTIEEICKKELCYNPFERFFTDEKNIKNKLIEEIMKHKDFKAEDKNKAEKIIENGIKYYKNKGEKK